MALIQRNGRLALNIKKALRIPKEEYSQFNFSSQLLRIFANELTWIDLYCLQPREKSAKTYPFRCRPARKILPSSIQL